MWMRSGVPAVLAVVLLCAAAWASAAPQDSRPLPEAGPFLEQVRQHLRTDRALLSQYTFIEKETERRVDGRGKVTKEETTIAEVYPSPEEEEAYRRVLVVNGAPVKPEELEKKDRQRREQVLEREGKRQRESEDDHRKRLAKEAEERRKEQETTDEILRIFDVRLLARETIGGRPAILCNVTPRADYKPRTGNGKILKKFAGRAWFDETDHEMVRAEVESIDDLTFGFGVLARLHKGTRFQFQRTKVNDEVWLPAEVRYWVSARIALLKRVRVEGLSTYSDYRKFSVGTSTTFGPPKPPQ
jgi:hypothetical protein